MWDSDIKLQIAKDIATKEKLDNYFGTPYSERDIISMKNLSIPISNSIVAPTGLVFEEKAYGVKNDNGKPDMTDIPLEAMWAMGAAFTHGQKKYGKNNYRQGMLASRQLAAAVRHIYQHLAGETLDHESGTKHLGHAMASIAMALYTIENHPNLDDRHPDDIAKYNKKEPTE